MTNRPMARIQDRRGFALFFVLLLTMIVGAVAMSAVTMFGNAAIVNAHAEVQAEMEAAALAGLELGRALVNRDPDVYPDSGYAMLPALELRDARGQAIGGFTRRIYAGPTGVSTGQFGVFGSVVSVVENGRGNRSIFRREMVQESFAKFAYFTDKETQPNGDPIYFAPGDQLFGPVHSNDVIRVMNSGDGPIFHGPVTTHETISNKNRAQFRQGYEERVTRINLPDVAELSRLRTYAQDGAAVYNGSTAGADGMATMRIEFIAIDVDGDGSATGENEGFFKVYRAAAANSEGARWVTAGRTSPTRNSPNCGHRHIAGNGTAQFFTGVQHDSTWVRDADGNWVNLEGNSTSVLQGMQGWPRARCYLGGSDSLSVDLEFRANDGRGNWIQWTGSWASPMPAAIASRADANYLVPMGRAFNPNFKGVIHVTGRVAISGVLRGRVTLAATDDIVIADDVQYATDPAAATCQDILGLFAGGDIVVSDNSVNAPMQITGAVWRSFDSTPDEVVHGVLLTLGSFRVANYNSGPDDAEPCQGDAVGRGCLYVTGGIIQNRRGPVGQQAWGGATGYLKRYSYDQCAGASPPPYFPTTGYFTRGRVFEVNPVGFDVAELFARLSAG